MTAEVGIDGLLSIVEAARRGGADPALVSAFDAGINAWLEDGHALELALGLRTGEPGIESARTQWRRAQRDSALRAAWLLLDAPTPWKRTVALAEELRTFDGLIRRAWSRGDGPPPNCSELRRRLYAARMYGEFPRLSRLHSICTRY